MTQFDNETVTAMRTALDEVCQHVPVSATSARTIVATRILQRANEGKACYDDFREVGRRAILDQFASVEAAILK
jgi:hypothetical protein